MPNGRISASGRKQDPLWLHFKRVPKGKGYKARCKKCNQEFQGLISRMKKHYHMCHGIDYVSDSSAGNYYIIYTDIHNYIHTIGQSAGVGYVKERRKK